MLFCGTLGAGLHLIGIADVFAGLGEITSYLIPLALYFVYATRMLPGLRVFKHILRGYSYMNLERLRLSHPVLPPGAGTRPAATSSPTRGW